MLDAHIRKIDNGWVCSVHSDDGQGNGYSKEVYVANGAGVAAFLAGEGITDTNTPEPQLPPGTGG